MSIFKSILTAIRGGASEAGEAIIDANAIRILEQEIRDADNGIRKATSSLTQLKSKEIGLSKELTSLNADITDYTAKAKGALTGGNEPLARQIAEKIVELTETKDTIESQQKQLDSDVNKIHAVIKQRKAGIEKNRIELNKVKVYDDLAATRKAVAQAMPSSSDSSAQRVNRALDRVKQKQASAENQLEADQWLNDLETGADLDAQINAAGLGNKGTSADDILASLK